MQEIKKSKKKTIEKLRMILDNPHIKDPYIKGETNLSALQKRLVKPSDESFVYTPAIKQKENDSLRANVTIHRKKDSISSSQSKYIETEKLDLHEQKEDLFEEEELYEIVKIQSDVPEFIEVKSKEYIKTEEEIPNWETIEDLEDKEIHEDIDEEFPEWEPVEPDKIDVELKNGKLKKEEEIPEWKPISIEDKEKEQRITEKKEEKKVIFQESSKEYYKKMEVFKEIESIDEKTAILLYNNGFTSINEINDVTLEDLIRIKGIKRRIAKNIKREIKKKIDEKEILKHESLKRDKVAAKKPKKTIKSEKKKGYIHGEYSLYKKEMKLGSDKKRTIHFFSKDKPDDSQPVNLPDGYEVKVNRITGVPYISRKK
jgi:hypothetical protein